MGLSHHLHMQKKEMWTLVSQGVYLSSSNLFMTSKSQLCRVLSLCSRKELVDMEKRLRLELALAWHLILRIKVKRKALGVGREENFNLASKRSSRNENGKV